MSVVEFALIKLKADIDEPSFVDVLIRCIESQDKWMRQHQPDTAFDNSLNHSSIFISRTEPNYLLITAPWASPEAHGEWIASDVNRAGFAELAQYFVAADDAVVLFHMKPAGKKLQIPEWFTAGRHFVARRIFVEAAEKDVLQEKYLELEKSMNNVGQGDRIWAGWRIETTGEIEELVIIYPADDVPAAQVLQASSLSTRTETRCYQYLR
jgi:hypothetical protein